MAEPDPAHFAGAVHRIGVDRAAILFADDHETAALLDLLASHGVKPG